MYPRQKVVFVFFERILISSEVAGGRCQLVALMFIFDWMDDLSCKYCRNWLLLMPNTWNKWGNKTKVLVWKICLKCVMSLSANVWMLRVFLLLKKSELFQIWVKINGEVCDFVKFPPGRQSPGYCYCFETLVDWLRNGMSEIWMSWHVFCLMSKQVLSECLGCVHLCMYCSWFARK